MLTAKIKHAHVRHTQPSGSGGGLTQTAWVPRGPSPPTPVPGASPWFGPGEWARTGHNEFAITVLIPRFSSTGDFVGLSKSLATIQLDHSQLQADGLFAGSIL